MIPVLYYNGTSAKGRAANLYRQGKNLHLFDHDGDQEYIIPIDDVELQKGREFVTLIYQDQIIEVKLADQNKLSLETVVKKSDFSIVLRISSILLPSVIMFWYFSGPLIQLLAKAIPDSFLNSHVESTIAQYKGAHCLNAQQTQILEKIFVRLGEDPKNYKIYVAPNSEANAFAFLGNLMVINHGLLKTVTSPDALAGIIAHELAHIKHEHVKRKYVKNILVEATWDFTLGRSAPAIFKAFLGDAFSQVEEREADIVAAKVLREKEISHEGTRKFFQDLDKKEDTLSRFLVLSHPSYPDRINTFSGEHKSREVLSSQDWKLLTIGCKSSP